MGDDSGAGGAGENPLGARLDAAADALGVCLGKKSRARKHGFRPLARAHVERFFLVRVLGVRVEDLARSTGHSRSAMFASVKVGAELVRLNARLLGFRPEDLGP